MYRQKIDDYTKKVIIGLVEDSEQWRSREKRVIECFFKERNIDCEIVEAQKKDEVEKIDLQKINLWFLDIELEGGMEGYDIARDIRKKDLKVPICFLTSHIEYARAGYYVNAYRYIDKAFLEEIDEALESFIETYRKKEIEVKDNLGCSCTIELKTIQYIETYGRKLKYHVNDSKVMYSDGNVKDVEKKLKDDGFIRIQRSYVVNMRYIRSYDSRKVELYDGTELTISRNKLSDFRRCYFIWRKNN